MSETTATNAETKAKPFLTAHWSQLLMFNYTVDPALLQSSIPPGTELDEHNGHCFVSIVGFLFTGTRLAGWRIPGYQRFEEVNLRYYVRRRMPEGDRRGVAFIKEIVPHWATAKIARWFYNENYVARAMDHHLDAEDQNPRRVEYRWREHGKWNKIGATLGDAPAFADEGSETEFITEHYWGYVGQRDGSCIEYAVEHPRWRIFQPTQVTFDVDVAGTYGPHWGEALSQAHHSVFVAEGSPVTVRRGVKMSDR